MELIDLRAAVVQGAFKAINSRRVMDVLRKPRAFGLLLDAMSIPAWCRSTLKDSGRSLARVLGLATDEDLVRVELEIEQRLQRRLEGRGSPGREN